MAGGVIIRCEAGKQPPEEYLKTILSKVEFRCFGIAAAKDGKLTIKTIHGRPELAGIKEALSFVPDHELLMHFGLYPQTYNETDRQPFPLLHEDDDPDIPLICTVLSGNFIANLTDSNHLDVWHMANDYLVDKLDSNYEMCGKDLGKLVLAMRRPSFEKDVWSQIKSEGAVAFLCADGQSWVDAKELKTQFNGEGWWTNNHLGWKPGQVVAKDNATERTAPPVDGPKRASFKEQLAAARGGTAPITPASMAGPKDFRDAKKPELSDYSELIPKSVLRGKLKEVRKWCRSVCGQEPIELQQETDMGKIDFTKLLVITHSKRAEYNADLKAWEAKHPTAGAKPTLVLPQKSEADKPLTTKEKIAALRAAKAAAEAPPTPVEEPPFEVEPDKTDVSGTPHNPSREFVPVIPPDQKEAIELMILQSMSDDGKQIPDPKKAKESSFASFSECFGLTSLSGMRLSKDDIWTLVQDYPVGAAVLLMEYQSQEEKRSSAASPPAKSVAA